MILIPAKRPHQFDRILLQIEDLPYANSLSSEAYAELKSDLDEKIAKYYRQRRAAAKAMAKKKEEEEQ